MSSLVNAEQVPLAGAPTVGDKFENTSPFEANTWSTMAKVTWRMIAEKRVDQSPAYAIPVTQINEQSLKQPGFSLYRLGHSSTLLNFDGELWLIDPVLSERASPLQFIGPKRFHEAPIDLAKLPQIKGVIISHDHYDHLDKGTIKQIKDKVEHFVTPLRVGEHLLDWGVAEHKIHQLDWWQELELGSLKLAATPAQHFSGRGLTDGNHTLWASWVIEHPSAKIFYSGDGGYFDGFKQIGEVYGPFDLTLMENGAYDKDWPHVHMSPEQTMQAHLDVKGKLLLPVHNSTFDLAMHAWYEPLDRLQQLALEHRVQLVSPEIGQAFSLEQPTQGYAWWKRVKNQQPDFEQVLAE